MWRNANKHGAYKKGSRPQQYGPLKSRIIAIIRSQRCAQTFKGEYDTESALKADNNGRHGSGKGKRMIRTFEIDNKNYTTTAKSH